MHATYYRQITHGIHTTDILLDSYSYTCALQGSAKEHIESLGYTSKEINTVAGMHTYATISVCSYRDLHRVEEIWQTLFKNVDVMFFANTQIQKSGNHGIS